MEKFDQKGPWAEIFYDGLNCCFYITGGGPTRDDFHYGKLSPEMEKAYGLVHPPLFRRVVTDGPAIKMPQADPEIEKR